MVGLVASGQATGHAVGSGDVVGRSVGLVVVRMVQSWSGGWVVGRASASTWLVSEVRLFILGT